MLKSEIISYVIAEYMKEKMVSSTQIVRAPKPEDISLLLECFIQYLGHTKKVVDGKADISDISVR